MREPRFVLVGLGIKPIDQGALDAIIDSESFDWLRYGACNYIAWSSSDLETIVRKIVTVPNMDFLNVFASPLYLREYYGSLPPWVWEWLRKDRGLGNVLETFGKLAGHPLALPSL